MLLVGIWCADKPAPWQPPSAMTDHALPWLAERAPVATLVKKRQDGVMARSTNTQFAVAVHVLVILAIAPEGHTVSSEELSKSANVNPVYVRRVLGPMRNAGLVRSRSGANGGWELVVDPAQITLEKVWLVLQGDEPVLGLHGPDPTCVTGRSVQKSLVSIDRRVADAVATALGHFTVQEIAQGVPEAALLLEGTRL
ncbi:Rrf2 family transcriptional regulator [Streptomyces tauricus]|uniref:Rrf2 family transcriptional regulator n=1 Tax=Streptomyces tauricus TaxID=68274 RepID=UPI0033BAFF89